MDNVTMLARLDPMPVSLNVAAKASAGVLKALHNHIVKFWTVLPVNCVKQPDARGWWTSPSISPFYLYSYSSARCYHLMLTLYQ